MTEGNLERRHNILYYDNREEMDGRCRWISFYRFRSYVLY